MKLKLKLTYAMSESVISDKWSTELVANIICEIVYHVKKIHGTLKSQPDLPHTPVSCWSSSIPNICWNWHMCSWRRPRRKKKTKKERNSNGDLVLRASIGKAIQSKSSAPAHLWELIFNNLRWLSRCKGQALIAFITKWLDTVRLKNRIKILSSTSWYYYPETFPNICLRVITRTFHPTSPPASASIVVRPDPSCTYCFVDHGREQPGRQQAHPSARVPGFFFSLFGRIILKMIGGWYNIKGIRNSINNDRIQKMSTLS